MMVLLKTPRKYTKLDNNKNRNAAKVKRTPAIFVHDGIFIMFIIHSGKDNHNSHNALSNDPAFNKLSAYS